MVMYFFIKQLLYKKMKVCVLVASHIRYKGQIKLLEECLESLIYQTYNVDTYVSISFETDGLLRSFKKNIKTIFPDIRFTIQKNHLRQMEHIKYMVDNYIEDYDLVLFCDDDDNYDSRRIEYFVKSKNKHIGINVIKENSDNTEIWNYASTPFILKDFFAVFDEKNKDLLNNNFSDYYLRRYLSNQWSKKKLMIEKPYLLSLYNYNIENINRISLNISKNNNESLKEKILIAILEDNKVYLDYIANHIKKNHNISSIVQKDILKKILNDYDKIIEIKDLICSEFIIV